MNGCKKYLHMRKSKKSKSKPYLQRNRETVTTAEFVPFNLSADTSLNTSFVSNERFSSANASSNNSNRSEIFDIESCSQNTLAHEFSQHNFCSSQRLTSSPIMFDRPHYLAI